MTDGLTNLNDFIEELDLTEAVAELDEEETDEEETEEVPEVWMRNPNRASRRLFVKQWGQEKRSRRTRGHSLGRKPKKRTLAVSKFLTQ